MSRSLAPVLLLALSAFAAGPPAAGPAPGACGGVHVVVRGDTLYSIARRCRSTVVAIAEASRLADPRLIKIGQQLIIPGGRGPAATEPGVPFPPVADKPEPMAVADAALGYRFQPGDTLYSLARWAHVSVGALLAANPGINPHKIEIGDAVRLPAGAVRPETARARERGPGAPPPPAAPPPRHSTPLPPPRPNPGEMRPPSGPPPPPPHRPKPDDEERDTMGI